MDYHCVYALLFGFQFVSLLLIEEPQSLILFPITFRVAFALDLSRGLLARSSRSTTPGTAALNCQIARVVRPLWVGGWRAFLGGGQRTTLAGTLWQPALKLHRSCVVVGLGCEDHGLITMCLLGMGVPMPTEGCGSCVAW